MLYSLKKSKFIDKQLVNNTKYLKIQKETDKKTKTYTYTKLYNLSNCENKK